MIRLNLSWLVLIFLKVSLSSAGTFSVDYTNHIFLKDGKPFKYISGTFHYFRVHPDYWDDRLKRVRALGLNAIQTYTAWNLHEPKPGNFHFDGFANVTRFFDLAQQHGLYVLLRPGPYIDAEWEYGGLPYWLLKYDNIHMRTSDPNFTNAVKNYFNVLLDVIKPYLYVNGGPILMVQVENEYGNYLSEYGCDKNYTTWLKDLVRSKLGDDVVLYTVDNPHNKSLTCGAIPGTATTVDFSPSNNSIVDGYFAIQDEFSGGALHVCTEYYTDWFLGWGSKENKPRSTDTILSNLDHFYKTNASTNLYCVLGTTNFEFNNCATLSGKPVETSYWVNAPIKENGDFSEMGLAIRNFIANNLTGWDHMPTPLPPNNNQIQETCQQSQNPMSFEELDHPYGYVLYTTTLKTGGTKFSAPNIRDYGYVFVNNVYQGMLYGSLDVNITTLTLPHQASVGDTLKILVENRGRLCNVAVLDRKGLHNGTTLNDVPLHNWYQCGINLTRSSIETLIQNFYESKLTELEIAGDVQEATSTPGVYAGEFTANPIADTFLDTTGWGKGQLFINGYNLGRYWPIEGHQMALYVPKPFLQQTNTILMIDLIGTQQNYVNFVDHPIFVYKN